MATLILPGGASSAALGAALRGNTAVYIGDSRNAQRFLDTGKQNKNSQNWSVWMDAYLRTMGKPMTTIGHFAVSGTRSDQHIATQLQAAIALNPAFIFWQGFVNDIAQQYPTAGTCVATCFANYKTLVKTANAAGITFVHIWERGAGNFNATMIGNLNDVNRLAADWLAWGESGYMPSVIVIDPTPVQTTVSSNGTIVIPMSQDAVHDNIPGAKVGGFLAANKMSPHLRERPGHRLRNLSQAKVGLGSRSLIPANAVGFAGTTVAATGTGNTGSVPPGLSPVSCSGGVTAAYSVQATSPDADGNTWGNEVKIVVTATAAGTAGCLIALDRTSLAIGSIVRGGMEYDCASGATGLSNAYADLEWFPSGSGATPPMYDMLPPAATGWGSDTGGETNLVLEPDALILTTFTGTPFTNLAFRVQMNGAGTATFITRKWWSELATA
jgi:hypothetical protein